MAEPHLTESSDKSVRRPMIEAGLFYFAIRLDWAGPKQFFIRFGRTPKGREKKWFDWDYRDWR